MDTLRVIFWALVLIVAVLFGLLLLYVFWPLPEWLWITMSVSGGGIVIANEIDRRERLWQARYERLQSDISSIKSEVDMVRRISVSVYENTKPR